MIMRTLSVFVIALCVGACSPAPSTDAARAFASDTKTATPADLDTVPPRAHLAESKVVSPQGAHADPGAASSADEPAVLDGASLTEEPVDVVETLRGPALAAGANTEAPADAVDDRALAGREPPPTPEEIDALIEAHGAPSQDELSRQVRSVGVAFDNSARRLGERLLIGRWQLSPESRAALNDQRGDAPPLTTMTLRFDVNGNIAMLMELGEDRYLDRGRWQLEGMYGAEVRVIVTSDDASARRERMLFLHIDRFILSPQDEALIFERRTP